jgi:hypothetical protein
MIDFSKNNQRFVFQSSFDKIEVMPVLHRNSVYFMGMGEREDYLCTKVIDDNFIALDKHGILTSWSIFTGKVSAEPVNLNEELEISGFEIYSHNKQTDKVFNREWCSKILLMSTKKNAGDKKVIRASKFLSYNDSIEKEDADFKLLEIVNQREVKIIASFKHPYYKGRKQFLHFSEKGDFMLEILDYNRFNVYQLKGHDTEANWQLQ